MPGCSSANVPEVNKKNPDHSAAGGSYVTFDEHCHTFTSIFSSFLFHSSVHSLWDGSRWQVTVPLILTLPSFCMLGTRSSLKLNQDFQKCATSYGCSMLRASLRLPALIYCSCFALAFTSLKPMGRMVSKSDNVPLTPYYWCYRRWASNPTYPNSLYSWLCLLLPGRLAALHQPNSV